MKHKITILAMSRKWGGRCVAGYDHGFQRLIRLVSSENGTELDTDAILGINLLDIVEVDIVKPCPHEHQTENMLIAPSAFLTVVGYDSIETFDDLVFDDRDVFGNNWNRVVDVSNVDHSIEIVKFRDMHIYVEDEKTKADFLVDGQCHKWYRVTDIAHEGSELFITNGYAIITIPPSDTFAVNHGYYKYIAAIYPINK